MVLPKVLPLTPEGFISEGSGENLFIIKDNKIYSPGLGNSILPGITRDSVIQLLTEKGWTVTEGNLPRELLYLADEVFMTGTAAEITPVSQIDHYKIGDGKRGPITEEVQAQFFDILQGRKADTYHWLTKV